jgi:hypothetical protein
MNDGVIHFNLSEAENKKPFHDLDSYVRKLAPDYLHTMEKVLNGEDIDERDIRKVLSILSDKLIPLYDSDGSIPDPEMAHLHEILVGVGRQL